MILLLAMLSSQAFSQTSSLFYAGKEEGMTITSGGLFHADGMTIIPSEDFNLNNTVISRVSSSTAKLANQASRVYQFSNPSTSFTGSLSMNYLDSELNGLNEQNLQIFIFSPNKWHRQSTNNDLPNNTLSSKVSKLSLSEITSAVFIPNLSPTSSSIAENTPAGSKVIELSGTDENLFGEEFTYSLVSGAGSADNAAFKINGSELQTYAPLDFEVKKVYSLRLRATDIYGRFDEKIHTVTIIDVNEAPAAIAISKSNLYEMNLLNQLVGTLSTTDQDAGDSHSYSLIAGAGATDNAAFNVSGNQVRASLVFNFSNKSSYSIRIRSTDKGGLSFDQVYTVTISQLPTLTGTGNDYGSKVQTAASTSPKISKGFTSNLNVSGVDIVSYNWNATSNLSSTTVYNPVAKPSQTQTYTVTVTNRFGSSTSLSITVEVMEDFNITANNILTPNGDGENDKWIIENLSSYPNNNLIIMDRSSRVIYRKTNYANEWDGFYNGSALPADTYYFILNFDSGKSSKKGFITIVH